MGLHLPSFLRRDNTPTLEPTVLEIEQRLASRRRFMKRALLAGASTALVSNELSQPAQSLHEQNNYPSPKLEEVLRIIKNEFPDIAITDTAIPQSRSHSPYPYWPSQRNTMPSVPPSVVHQECGDIEPDSILGVAERVLCHMTSPSDSTPDSSGLKNPITYAATYKRSKEEAKKVPKKDLDCNDHTNWACELLDEHHVPVYTVSTWASDAENGFEHWHIFTVCKVHDSKYLIIDNSTRATVWDGTLKSYISQYSGGTAENPTVRVVPYGISRYVRPKYENPLSKLLIQVIHTIDGEEDMKPIGEDEQPIPIHEPLANTPEISPNEIASVQLNSDDMKRLMFRP